MSDPRTALDRLIGALEAFYEAARTTQDPDADSVLEATDQVMDAYTIFDDEVFTAYGIESPLDIYVEDDEDFDDDDDEDYELFDEDDFDDLDDLDDEDDIDDDLDDLDDDEDDED